MSPLRGWFARGERLRAKVPFGLWKTMTFIAALRHDRIDAPFVFGGAMNAQIFILYIKTELIPTLSAGDVVIMDNLSSHKGQKVRRQLRSVGVHLLFLPVYSPDLNPIEQIFAKLKHFMRKSADKTVYTTWRRIGVVLDYFKSAECGRYFANAGYAPS